MFSELKRSSGEYFGAFLDTVGDGTGAVNANVSGSVGTPIDFKVVCPAGAILLIEELVVTVRDNAAFVANGYGAITTLANGVQVLMRQAAGAELQHRTAQRPLVCNGCWAMYATDYQIRLTPSGDQLHASVHKFSTPLILQAGGEYVVRVRDNLTGLTGHHFRVHGTKIVL